ncbi:MAG: cytochrome-c peroxidase [Rhodospirillales bacterium]|nr:cytochrome-c peroxidase [Rhodospirillales bacterium]
MARLGRRIFFDPSLSASGRLSCASCHSPAHHFGPPGDAPAMFGGPDLRRQGVRAVPSLMYLERQPNFAIGPDNAEAEGVNLRRAAARGIGARRARKVAGGGAASANLVPQGGLFWDGRADTLQTQAMGPLLSPFEMDGGSAPRIARRLARAPYAKRFAALFGPTIFADPRRLLAEALFALARYQVEAPAFHPYSSKFDAWLEGKARLTPAELRGWRDFNDPRRGNCAACHLDRPTADHRPPLFTDHQFEALGVPRNPALGANRDPNHFDLGLCGPYRTDLARETRYCGLFATPSLRNVASRHVFFHNGVYRSLRQVLDFYDFRDVAPGRVYPRASDGRIARFDDLPRRYRGNIDRADAPFGRPRGARPPLTSAEERDIIAFLGTLTDGYRPREARR